MRTEKLKKSTKYATENGTCVETGELIERGWYKYRETGKGEDKIVIAKGLPTDAPANDPWSNPHRNRYVRVGDKVLRDIVEGVPVTVHSVDGAGESTGTRESVVDPKFIKGTWEDYVRLHGNTLRSAAYKVEAEEAAKAESTRLNKLAKDAGLGDSARVSVSIRYQIEDREANWLGHGQTASGYRLVPSLSAEGETVEQMLFSYMSDGH